MDMVGKIVPLHAMRFH